MLPGGGGAKGKGIYAKLGASPYSNLRVNGAESQIANSLSLSCSP